MPDEVSSLDAEVAHQLPQVDRLLGDAHRPGKAVAARVADAVVAHDTVAARQDILLQEWPEPISEDAGGDQDHRLAGAPRLVLELETVQADSTHRLSSSVPGRRDPLGHAPLHRGPQSDDCDEPGRGELHEVSSLPCACRRARLPWYRRRVKESSTDT